MPEYNMNYTMVTTFGQSNYKFTIDFDTRNIKMSILEPKNISNFYFEGDENEFYIKCGDLKMKCDDGYYPFLYLYRTLFYIKGTTPVSTEKLNGEITATYINGNERYIVKFDEKNNKIKSIEIPKGLYIVE